MKTLTKIFKCILYFIGIMLSFIIVIPYTMIPLTTPNSSVAVIDATTKKVIFEMQFISTLQEVLLYGIIIWCNKFR